MSPFRFLSAVREAGSREPKVYLSADPLCGRWHSSASILYERSGEGVRFASSMTIAEVSLDLVRLGYFEGK